MDKVYLAYNRMGRRMRRGEGAPVGVPSRVGEKYLDTTTGVVYLGRNVLNFNGSSISIPVVTNARRVNLRFWHNDPSPSATRTFHDGVNGDPTSQLIVSERVVTSGVLVTPVSGQSLFFNGVLTPSGTINPSANTWHTLGTQSDLVDRKLAIIGRSRIGSQNFLGRIADVQALGVSGTLLASYSINEGSGTTIIDSVSGQNGTLTLGSGSWQLDWVPQN